MSSPNFSIYKVYDLPLQNGLTLTAAETEGNNEFECKLHLELTVFNNAGQRVWLTIDQLSAENKAFIEADMARMLQEQLKQDNMDPQGRVHKNVNSREQEHAVQAIVNSEAE